MCIRDSSNISEKQKIPAILIKDEGYPREMLADVDDSRDQRFLLSNIKQLPEESVKVYSSRLKVSLSLLGIGTNDVVCLNHFLKGLLTHFALQVKSLVPRTFEDAEYIALQMKVNTPLSLIHDKTDNGHIVEHPVYSIMVL